MSRRQPADGIDLKLLPAGQVVDAPVERLLRLRAGEGVELRFRADLGTVWQRVDRLDPRAYSFVYLENGPR